MARRFFGTDGIRGTANQEPMTAETALRAGMAAGSYFQNGGHRHKVVIGKDTRLSGYMIEPALVAGFTSVGMDVILVGPMPTPAVAMLTRSLRADLGVMISASHNLYHDNGIKLFDRAGLKLSDEVEQSLEDRMTGKIPINLAESHALGRAKRLEDAYGRYIEFVKQTFPRKRNLDGFKIVLDCANGAAYRIAPAILWELEAEVIAMGNTPDGFNINKECGSTAPEELCARVIKEKADIGIALDGDADRLIVCDEKGQVIDGDQLLALVASHQKDLGMLQGGGIVTTVMSNMGLEDYLTSLDLSMKRTKVGDRYVMEQMTEGNFNIGGEQSGHIIMRDYCTTGDGIVAGLQILAVLAEQPDTPASQILKVFEPYPQILRNIRYKNKDPLEDADVKHAITDAEQQLGDKGRVLIRKSGTEPLIRVMVEGKERSIVKKLCDNIAEAVQHAAQ